MANEPNYRYYPIELLFSDSFTNRQKMMFAYAAFFENIEDIYRSVGVEDTKESYEELMAVADAFIDFPIDRFTDGAFELSEKAILDKSISNNSKLLYMFFYNKKGDMDSLDVANKMHLFPEELHHCIYELSHHGYIEKDRCIDPFIAYKACIFKNSR